MIKSENDYTTYRILRSAEIFEDAKLLAENQRWRSCANRLYYSSFQLVDALLRLDNIPTKTHEGLKTKFLQLYVKTGIIDIESGKLYSKLLDWRQESDYSVFVDFNSEDIEPLLNQVKDLNLILLALINEKHQN
jgi:uncharacterized protein